MLFARIEILDILTYVLMFAGLVAVIWGIKNLNKTSNGRIVMIAGAVVLFGSAIYACIRSMSDNTVENVTKVKTVFLTAKAAKAADFIRERYPENPTVAFLISEEAYNNADSDDRIVFDELKKRLEEAGISCDKVITLKTSEDEGENASKKNAKDPADAFKDKLNTALKEVKDNVNILVNFIGLPESAGAVSSINFIKETRASAGKNDMLLMSALGFPYVKQSMIENNHICAIIEYTSEEGSNFNVMKDKAPKDLNVAFDYNYFFVKGDTLADFNSKENDTYFVSK